MKATHKLTYIPDGHEYLFSVVGDIYHYLSKELPGWSVGFDGFKACYVDNDKWLVEMINIFKGNK